MESYHPFTDAGFKDLETGAALFSAFQVGPVDLNEPSTVQKLKEIADFLNTESDPLFTISKLSHTARGTTSERLNHVWSWVTLSKQKQELARKLSEVDKELSHYG